MIDRKVPGIPWVIVSGHPGAGKSTLAASGKNGYCFDTEPPGSAALYPAHQYTSFAFEPKQYEKIVHAVDKLKVDFSYNSAEQCLENEITKIGYLVIDTFDTLQKTLLTAYLKQKKDVFGDKARPNMKIPAGGLWAPKADFNDWGQLRDIQAPLIFSLKELPIPVVWVAHSKVIPPVYKPWGDLQNRGAVIFDIAGSIEEWIVNLCDFNLVVLITDPPITKKSDNEPNGTQFGIRVVYTQLCIEKDIMISGKDRLGLFRDMNVMSWTYKLDAQGQPVNKPLDRIFQAYEY